MSIITLEYMQKVIYKKSFKKLDVLNNPTKFQLNWMRTYIFQLKLCDLWPYYLEAKLKQQLITESGNEHTSDKLQTTF